MNNRVFVYFSFGIVAFGIYHLIGIFYKIDMSPAWRHGFFFALSIFGIYGVLKRPRYFVFLFPIIVGQQLYSHGTDFINYWTLNHRIDWLSLFVLVFMPTLYALLVMDLNKKTDKNQ
ncbi:MAG TPA: hypothetical protein VIH57_09730 [Bacteroidales bacterium]